MATKDQLEQKALGHIKRGNYSKAAHIYHAILRQMPRDIRVRQKLGELYFRMGQKKEGVKYMREVAGLHQREGHHRQAIAIYRQLLQQTGEDFELLGALADCYRDSTQLHEAGRVYEQAMNVAKGARKWEHAVNFATELVKIQPSDLSLQFTLADFKKSADDIDGALEDYKRMASAFERRGEMGEVARVAESALRIEDDNVEFIGMAIKARVSNGDFQRALEHGNNILDKLAEQETEVIEAVSLGLLRTGQESKARKLFLEVATRYRKVGDSEGQARALRMALESGADDQRLRDAVAQAEARSAQLKRRLSDEGVLSPTSDSVLVHCTKAEVLARYGFPDRALTVLKAARKESPNDYAIGVRIVEVLWELGKRPQALELLEKLVRSGAGQARQVMASRLLILGGPDLLPSDATGGDEADEEALIDDEDEALIDDEDEALIDDDDEALIDDDELATDEELLDDQEESSEDLLDDELDEAGPMAQGEALLARGDHAGAIAAFQEVFREDPLNDDVLMRIAEVRRLQREADQPSAEPEDFEEVSDDHVAEEPPASDDDLAGELGFSPFQAGGSTGGAPMAGIGTTPGQGAAKKPAAAGMWKALLGGKPKDEESESEQDKDAKSSGPVDLAAFGDATVETAWALVSVGKHREALEMSRGLFGLAARWVEARALGAMGQASSGLNVLRDSLEDADEDDPVYPEALYLLATFHAGKERYRAALRVARELEDLYPDWRPNEVAALLRGLRMLR